MKALVLGGGSVKGAWQASAIKAVFDSGFVPDIITTISVGTINGMLIVSENGRLRNPLEDANPHSHFKMIGRTLTNVWESDVQQPSDLVKKPKIFPLAWKTLTGKFDGLCDNTPIKKLVEKHMDLKHIRASKINIFSGCINLDNGEMFYADKSLSQYMEYAIASTSIPIVMPSPKINNHHFTDGGLIDSAPLAKAFKEGASEIICIANHPKYIGTKTVNIHNPIQYAERALEIMLNNNLRNDVREAELINEIAPEDGSPLTVGIHKGKKRIPLTIIQPEKDLDYSITKFTSKDIKEMLTNGYEVAEKILNARA